MAEEPGRLDPSFSVDRWKRLLGQGGRLRLRMVGSEMVPALQPGDLLEFEEARLMALARGDIVVVHSAGRCLLRRVRSRVLEQGGEVFTVAADGLEEPPLQVGFEEILARLVCLEREGEVLRPAGDSTRRARWRRRLRERVRHLWYSLLLRLG